MPLGFLLERFEQNRTNDALVWRGKTFSYDWLLARVEDWRTHLRRERKRVGETVFLHADFSPNSIAILLALVQERFIVIPSAPSCAGFGEREVERMSTAMAELCIRVSELDEVQLSRTEYTSKSQLYDHLCSMRHPGLVLFSSGSSGRPKAAVHDFVGLLDKFKTKRHCRRVISFLLFDHIGGINTLLYTLSNGGCVVTVLERSPDAVFEAIEAFSADTLPTSPTFLNLVLLGDIANRFNANSLKLVTYGTEPMPESTLKRFHEVFPDAELRQTYGLSEIGILRSKSKASDSLFMKIGGEGFETRVRNGKLEVRARSVMLGYLNAPSPLTKDGWLATGDRVEVDGEYIKILGRESEVINVGGQKVNPVEVESVLQEVDDVLEATVYGEPNFVTGQIVCARVVAKKGVEGKVLRQRLRKHCEMRLANYKVPVKIEFVDTWNHAERLKKRRNMPDTVSDLATKGGS